MRVYTSDKKLKENANQVLSIVGSFEGIFTGALLYSRLKEEKIYYYSRIIPLLEKVGVLKKEGKDGRKTLYCLNYDPITHTKFVDSYLEMVYKLRRFNNSLSQVRKYNWTNLVSFLLGGS